MKPTEPLQINHSWPLFERGQRFDLGHLHDPAAFKGALATGLVATQLARPGIGLWQCDLRDNALTWTAEVYDIFGLPVDAPVARAEAVALYCEGSRAAMERLRAYAIRHQRGFTLDAEIWSAQGEHRWMRLTAAPVCEGGRVVRLHGLKQIVTHEYRQR